MSSFFDPPCRTAFYSEWAYEHVRRARFLCESTCTRTLCKFLERVSGVWCTLQCIVGLLTSCL